MIKWRSLQLQNLPEDALPPPEESPCGAVGPDTPCRPKVRPIQMGELPRKFVSKRLLQVAQSRVLRTLLSSRQWGGGSIRPTAAVAESVDVTQTGNHDANHGPQWPLMAYNGL